MWYPPMACAGQRRSAVPLRVVTSAAWDVLTHEKKGDLFQVGPIHQWSGTKGVQGLTGALSLVSYYEISRI